MKKIFYSILIFCILLCSCSSNPPNMKKIHIENCGTLKIPEKWEFFVKDSTMYITNGENPIMISYNRTGKNETNSYFHNYRYIEVINSSVLSNGVIYGKARYSYNDSNLELYYLNLGYANDKLVEFVVWNTEIDEDLIISIAKTFVLN